MFRGHGGIGGVVGVDDRVQQRGVEAAGGASGHRRARSSSMPWIHCELRPEEGVRRCARARGREGYHERRRRPRVPPKLGDIYG
jgi:hypothetical protein